jgi:hypothetical protein
MKGEMRTAGLSHSGDLGRLVEKGGGDGKDTSTSIMVVGRGEVRRNYETVTICGQPPFMTISGAQRTTSLHVPRYSNENIVLGCLSVQPVIPSSCSA